MATYFNVKDVHVRMIKQLLQGKDIVVIHGDGTIFACNANETETTRDDTGKVITLPVAHIGSKHHGTFNSGFDTNEQTAKASFKAVYRKGDAGPGTPDEIIEAFYKNVKSDLDNKVEVKDVKQANILKLDAAEEVKTDTKDENAVPKSPGRTKNK